MNIIKNYGWNSKLGFNASTNSKGLSEIKGQTVTVTASAMAEEISEEGVMQPVGYIVDEHNTIYSTISRTATKAIDSLVDLMQDVKGPVQITIIPGKSKNGREYLTLALV